MGTSMFLRTPPTNEARATLYSRDVADDGEIFDVSAFIAFRMAFSTVNDALGAHADRELAAAAPAAIRDAVTYGRRVSEDVPKHASFEETRPV